MADGKQPIDLLFGHPCMPDLGLREKLGAYYIETAKILVAARLIVSARDGHSRTALDELELYRDRKSTRLNSSHFQVSRMPSSA